MKKKSFINRRRGTCAVAKTSTGNPYYNQNMSEETARLVDSEIKRLVTEGYEEAKKILTKHKKDWETLALALMEYETLTGDEIKDVIKGKLIDKSKDAPVPEEKKTKSSVPEL